MLDNVNHISGVWGTRRGSVTQSLFFFFFFPLLPVHMTRCQMRVSAFRLYIYISLPHPHTHTHTLQDIYACAHPRTYILMKHKTLFQVTLSTRALILLYSLNPENLILKCITFTAWKQAAKDPNNLTAVPPGSPFFYFETGPEYQRPLSLRVAAIKSPVWERRKKKKGNAEWQYTCCCVMWHSKKAYWETDG